MKQLYLIAIFLITLTHAQADERAWCLERATSEVRSLLLSDHSNFLVKQFELTTLKLALVTSGHKDKTLEDYVKSRALELEGSSLIGEVAQLYTSYGEQKSIDQILETLELANYWQAPMRLTNEDGALFVELHRLSSANSPFTKTDSAILWLFDYISEELGAPGSASFNQSLSSTHVARLLGALDTRGTPSFATIVRKVEQLEDELENDFRELMTHMSAEWKLRCNPEEMAACFESEIWQLAVITLKRENDWLTPIKRSLLESEGIKLELINEDNAEIFARAQLSFSSLADLLIYDQHYLLYRDIDRYQRELNSLEDAQTIIKFHQDSTDQRPYAIADKKQGVLYLINHQGELLETRPMKALDGDDTYEAGGAGVYELEASEERSLALLDESGRGLRLEIKQGSVYSELGRAGRLYILPNDPTHLFKVKNGELHFTTSERRQSYSPYNYSPKSVGARKTVFYINNFERRNSTSQRFVNQLSIEKARLMKLYRLDNDEYNELARLAFGILGNESDYGRSFKYHVKESIPLVVALLKGEGFDTTQNSRGLTQIKKVPALIEKEYGTKKEDLVIPEHAAVATLGFLADALSELKVKARLNPDINSDNQYDYLHYIYTGRSSEITERTATPEQNIYLRQIKEAAKGLLILERKDS